MSKSKQKSVFLIMSILLALFGFSLTVQAVSYKYDDLGRLLEITYDSGQKEIYT